MKILEIVPSLSGGGGERLVVDLSNELAKTNEVVLMTFWDNKIDNNDFYLGEVSDKVKYYNIPVPKDARWKTWINLYKFAKQQNADIIHLHMCLTFAILIYVLLGYKKNIYITIHGDISSYNSLQHKLIFNIFGRLGWVKFVTISDTNFESFKSFYPFIAHNLVYNGRAPLARTSEYSEVKRQIDSFKKDDSTVIFIHVARYHPVKDQKLLVSSFNEFARKGYNVTLVILGLFPDEAEPNSIKNMACENIHFVGAHHNVADYLYCCDIFCLSSISEAMPISMIEAMNCGLALLSTPVSGMKDQIKDGINGYVAKDHSQEEYVKILIKAVDNHETIINNAKEQVANCPFTIKKCAEKYMDLFASV